MAEQRPATCCSPSSAEKEGNTRCPASRGEGAPVGWTTVAALAAGPIPPRQEFRLCRDADCQVVYYGSDGAMMTVGDVHVQPGFKDGGDGLLCYCFLHRRSEFARELETTGESGIFASIRHEVEAGQCACEVRNPTGRCCLGEVRDAIQALRREAQVTT